MLYRLCNTVALKPSPFNPIKPRDEAVNGLSNGSRNIGCSHRNRSYFGGDWRCKHGNKRDQASSASWAAGGSFACAFMDACAPSLVATPFTIRSKWSSRRNKWSGSCSYDKKRTGKYK